MQSFVSKLSNDAEKYTICRAASLLENAITIISFKKKTFYSSQCSFPVQTNEEYFFKHEFEASTSTSNNKATSTLELSVTTNSTCRDLSSTVILNFG